MTKAEAEFYETKDNALNRWESDEDFDARVMECIHKHGCIVGVPNLMRLLDYRGADRVRAALYRLDEQGLAQWDITDSVYLTSKGVNKMVRPDEG